MLLKETKWIQMIMVWNNKKERHFSCLKHLFLINFLRYYCHLFSEGKYYVCFTFVKWNKWAMLTCYQGEYFILSVLFKSEMGLQWPHRRGHFTVQQNAVLLPALMNVGKIHPSSEMIHALAEALAEALSLKSSTLRTSEGASFQVV